MDVSAAQAQVHLRLGSLSLPVISLDGHDTLSEPFRFHIEVLADPGFSLIDSIGASAVASLVGKDGIGQEFSGVITALEEQGVHSDGRGRVLVRLESRLALLQQQSDTRIVLGKSLVEIVSDLLLAHGFSTSQLQFQLTNSYPLRPYTLQAGETDLVFLQRILANAGIFYWSESEEGAEIVRFSDHNCHIPFIDRKVVRYQPAAGMETTFSALELTGIRSLELRQSMIPGDIYIHDRNENSAALAVQGGVSTNATSGPFKPEQNYFGTGATGPDQAREQAQLRAERAAVEGFQAICCGNMADLAVGKALSLDLSLLAGNLSGDYLPIRIHHRVSQPSGEGVAGDDLAYDNQAWLIRRETPFRAPLQARPQMPMTFTARIESDGPYARLDEAGRYRLRTHFDREPRAHSEASIPIRRLSPYGGPPGEEATGQHLPLLDGAEVLLSCLNGDPDRPMIVGALPNPATASPVTSANAHQNRLRTAADNELCLDDKIDQEAITLRTYAGNNILHLDAAAVGHKIRLACEQGGMQLQAKKTMHLQSDASISERIGDDRVQIVENRHQTVTKTAEIHHQAATDYGQSAAQSIRMHASSNIEQTTGRHMRIDVEQGKQITVEGAKASFTVQDGTLHLQAAKDLHITGQGGGDISFGQAGGGFVIKTDGSVQLYGNKITLGGGGVSLNGQVNYLVGGGPPMPSGSVAAPLVPTEIQPIKFEGEPAVIDLAWNRDLVPAEEAVKMCFNIKNFKGGETAAITVSEVNADGSEKQVAQLNTTLDDGMGHYEIDWQPSSEVAQKDFEIMDEVQGGPLEYRFAVTVAGIPSDSPSGPLWLTRPLRVNLHSDGDPVPDGTAVQLVMADGTPRYGRAENQQVYFEEVLIGPIQQLQISDAQHRDTES